jgi:hypothetical protein
VGFDEHPVHDVYDITRYVQPVTVQSGLLAAPLTGFTNGKSVFLTEEQVVALSAVTPAGTLTETAPQQWVEVVPGKGERILAQRHIQDVTYYRFKSHWDFVPDSPS